MSEKPIKVMSPTDEGPQVCEHGTLKRKCLVCELQAEIAELRATMWQDGDIVRKENAELRARLAESENKCDVQEMKISRLQKELASVRNELDESDARCKAAETVLGKLGWYRTAAGWRDSRAPDSCTGCGNEYLHGWKGEE